MSASREKKNRQELASSGHVDPKAQKAQKAQEEQAKHRRRGTLTVVLAAAFIVCAIALFLWNGKVFQRSAAAVKVAGESYSASDVSFYYYTAINQFANGSSYTGTEFSTSQSMRTQDYPDGTSTWYDYFSEESLNDLALFVTLAKAGKAAGYTAESPEIKAEVDASMEDLATSAEYYGATKDQLLRSSFGGLMTEKTYRRNLEIVSIANAYRNSVTAGLTYTDEELEAALEESRDDYSSVDAEIILFSSGVGSDTSEEDAKTAMELARVNATAAITRYADGADLEEVAEELGGSYVHYTNLPTGTSAIQEWLYDSTRSAGDTGIVPYDENAGYYAVVFHGKSLNDFNAVSVRHILVADEETAEKVYAEWQSGAATEESFAALASTYSTDTGSSSNGGLYEDVTPGTMVDAFNDWCFDPARQSGDTGIVETEYGYHIMYFVSAADEPYWKTQVRSALQAADYNEWYTSIAEGVTIERLNGMKYVDPA